MFLFILAVQEVHDWLEHVVGLLHNAAVCRDSLTFHLSKDISHLPDIILDLRLETLTANRRNNLSTNAYHQNEKIDPGRISRNLTAKMRLRSSMTLLSLFWSSFRKSLASTLS